jgi:hypothetical protein
MSLAGEEGRPEGCVVWENLWSELRASSSFLLKKLEAWFSIWTIGVFLDESVNDLFLSLLSIILYLSWMFSIRSLGSDMDCEIWGADSPKLFDRCLDFMLEFLFMNFSGR